MAKWGKPKSQEELARDLAKLEESNQTLCSPSTGENWLLEDVANHLLAVARRGITRHRDLRDYLSTSQLDLRRGREVYTTNGTPDEAIVSGLYRRAYNPLSRGSHSSKSAPSLGGEDGS